MKRPEYPTVDPSIETWEDACVISQEWADGARRAAVKRRNLRAVAWLLLEIIVIVGFLYILFT